jgi:hypothetical protein
MFIVEFGNFPILVVLGDKFLFSVVLDLVQSRVGMSEQSFASMTHTRLGDGDDRGRAG